MGAYTIVQNMACLHFYDRTDFTVHTTYTLHNLSQKYGFNSSVASMKCAVMDCFASIVLCDM